MGFDGLFFGRNDYQDFDLRNRTKTMEMIWKGSANLGELSIYDSRLKNVYFRSSGLVIHWYSA